MRRQQPASSQIDTTAPKLTSLAPKYSFAEHGVYFTILKEAIENQPGVRNIALAGTYGTGKSSILGELATEFESRVVELSLLTLGAQPLAKISSVEVNEAATSTTNRIQKEIVKQLLYQQRPTKAPESRFHRIVRFRWGTELLFAGIAGLVAIVLAMVAGVDVVVGPPTALTFSDRPHVVVVVAMMLVIALMAGSITFFLRALVRGRTGIEKVTAGPATITLPPRSASYFDEYLDEIIYFFEMNPRRDIVIIEDLDRFNDSNIFEALRSLNGLLNAAQQLNKRNIRFIYAVRDSVFERLGRDEQASITDEAQAELVRANRTKFFELVVPVVPFITHKNARDLMFDLLDERGHTVSKDLVDIAARHLADMRLIHNVLNEYEVFKHRLLDVDVPVPELDQDRLFAMILFKNAHSSDFERIRHGSSSLDKLWEIWRELINANTDRLRGENSEIRRHIQAQTVAKRNAANVAKRLSSRLNALANASGTGLASSTLQYEGVDVSETQMTSTEFWSEFIKQDVPLTVMANAPSYNYGPQPMQLSRQDIEILTGLSLDQSAALENAATKAESEIAENVAAIAILQRLDWASLAADPMFTYAKKAGKSAVDFRKWTERLLPSRLAADLVIHGYITSYFALHVSSFYGKLIRPNAMTYVMRFVDSGRSDPDFPLDSEDVEAILRDQGSSVLIEPSMFNVGILDHLLASRPVDASVVLDGIPIGDSSGERFIDRYLESGSQKSSFVARLTPRMPGIFDQLVLAPTLEPSERIALFDAAIGNRSSRMTYSLSDNVRVFLEESYRDLAALSPNASEEAALMVVDFLQMSDATIATVAGLPKRAIAAFAKTRSYSLTTENLELIANSSDISLDRLAAVDEAMSQYAAASAAAYAEAFLESVTTQYTVEDPEYLIGFLSDARISDLEAIEVIVSNAAPLCDVDDLSRVPSAMWPTLVRNERALMTLPNVLTYLGEYGAVDEDLAVSLADVAEIGNGNLGDISDRLEVAVKILNSPAASLTSVQRVKLVQALDPGVVPADLVEPRSGTLVGELIGAGLLADETESFSSRLMVDWPTQAYAVRRSTNFTNIVGPTTLNPMFLAPLLRDDRMAAAHLSAAQALSSYKRAPAAAFEAYAERALAGGYSIGAKAIAMVRAGGVGAETIIQLLARFREKVSDDELRQILRSLGRPWAKVADPGYGTTELVDSPAARKLLERLQNIGVVSKFPEKNGRLRVSLRQR